MRILRRLLSPFAQTLRRLRPEFTGDYPSWSAATKAAEGYDAPQIIGKVRASALKVKNGQAVFERDSVCFYHEDFRWPLLSCLLHQATLNGGRLHVADFGGSLGSFYFQHRKFLDDITELKWSIVEQSEYVKVGRTEFQDAIVGFFSNLHECAETKRIDVALFSGSLQCVEDPFYFLKQAAGLSRCILIDRTPFLDRDTDRITVQRVPALIYRASYAHRFFSGSKFNEFMKGLGYIVFAEWDGFDKANIKCRYGGRAYKYAKQPTSQE